MPGHRHQGSPILLRSQISSFFAGVQASSVHTHGQLTNAGPGDSTGTTLTDPLPGGSGITWTLDTAGSSIPSGIACAVTGTAPSQTLSCGTDPSTSGTVTLAEDTSITLHVTSPTSDSTPAGNSCGPTGHATYANTASFVSGNDGSGDATASVVVNCPALSITKTADAASVPAGSPIGFTVTVSNSSTAGTGTALNATLNDPLPAGTGIDWSISPAHTAPGTCTINGTAPTQTLVCSFGDMAPGASATVHVLSQTTGATSGTFVNTATATATGMAPVQATASTIVQQPGGILAVTTPTPSTGANVPWARGIAVSLAGLLLLLAGWFVRRREPRVPAPTISTMRRR
jgi:uncharacterized repeat protein (TIGR01451 family)